MFQDSFFNWFLSVWRTSVSQSFRVGLLATNSLPERYFHWIYDSFNISFLSALEKYVSLVSDSHGFWWEIYCHCHQDFFLLFSFQKFGVDYQIWRHEVFPVFSMSLFCCEVARISLHPVATNINTSPRGRNRNAQNKVRDSL